MRFDWDALQAAAHAAMEQAYAPYSGYPVGAAAQVSDGRVVSGCNVENASYGLALCAECGMVSELIASGGGTLQAMVCVNSAGEIIMPCGRCRQVLSEHSDPTSVLMTPEGELTMAEVLPQAFSAGDLDHSDQQGI
ncbi:MAG: cytidine deaminase [Ornithinimicrobium sp.]